MKKIVLIFLFSIFYFLFSDVLVFAQDLSPVLHLSYMQAGDVAINNPENFQLFYDELKGAPRSYTIDSATGFNLHIDVLIPLHINPQGKYSAKLLYLDSGTEEQLVQVNGSAVDRQDFYNSFDREWYWKSPEMEKQLPAGKYKIEIYSTENKGRYVLNVGKNKVFNTPAFLNTFWQIPWMKMTFSGTSVLQFFITPTGIYGVSAFGGFLILLALIYYLIGYVKETIKHNEAKTLLLTSSGMLEMKDEIIKLLQKPAYDVEVVFITTAAKSEENLNYLRTDWLIMKEEMGFNVEEFDIEGKSEYEVAKFLERKDIIFVEGGNTYYLLNAMRRCNFEKIIRRLLKFGRVYIGVSAGSIVVGKTIQTAGWIGDKNVGNLKNLKGLGLVPFDIVPHYTPELAEIIKKEMPDPKKRAKNLRILTDSQAILVQGKEIDEIGDGDQIVV